MFLTDSWTVKLVNVIYELGCENMIEIKDKKNCTSCSACYSVCPVNAIEMTLDEEGFKYPKVDKEKCINCGLCEKICPIMNRVIKENNSKKPIVIAAWSKNNNIRLDSTSGGVFSELASVIYKQGGYVCGAIYNGEWLVEHYVSSDPKDIDNFILKYCSIFLISLI